MRYSYPEYSSSNNPDNSEQFHDYVKDIKPAKSQGIPNYSTSSGFPAGQVHKPLVSSFYSDIMGTSFTPFPSNANVPNKTLKPISSMQDNNNNFNNVPNPSTTLPNMPGGNTLPRRTTPGTTSPIIPSRPNVTIPAIPITPFPNTSTLPNRPGNQTPTEPLAPGNTSNSPFRPGTMTAPITSGTMPNSRPSSPSTPTLTIPGTPGNTPGITMPNITMPGTTMPGTNMPRSTMPGMTTPRTTMPGMTMPRSTMPNTTIPRFTMPDMTMPGNNMPGTMPGNNMPDFNMPCSNMPCTMPGNNMPGTIPGSNMPGTMPGNNMPGTMPGSNMPGTNMPGFNMPGTNMPNTTVPGVSPLPGTLPGTVPGVTPPANGIPGNQTMTMPNNLGNLPRTQDFNPNTVGSSKVDYDYSEIGGFGPNGVYMSNINPYHLPLGVPMMPLYGYDNSEDADKDLDYVKQMYPITAKKMLAEIDEECDKLEYDGSCMFDEYPDRIYLSRIVDKIYAKCIHLNEISVSGESLPTIERPTSEEIYLESPPSTSSNREDYVDANGKNWLRDMTEVLLYNEMLNRRRRYRSRKRWF